MFFRVIGFLYLFAVSYLLTAQTDSHYQWLIKAKNTASFPDTLTRSHSQPTHLKPLIQRKGYFTLKTPKGVLTQQQELLWLQSQHPHWEIEPDYLYILAETPNDPGFINQSNLSNNGQNGCESDIDIQMEEAWNLSTGDSNIIIVVLDGGIDLDHEDLKENLFTNLGEVGQDRDGNDKATNGIDDDGNGYIDDVHGWDFVNARDTIVDGNVLKIGGNRPEDDTPNGHGTHVSGIIAAKGNNGKGTTGICWDCKILPLKFTNANGHGRTSAAIEAIHYATQMSKTLPDPQRIVAINSSWGGGSDSQALKEAIEEAGNEELLFVAAAGNIPENNNDQHPFYPASYSSNNIISVSAMDCRGNLAQFSAFGFYSVDIAAPGEAIFSTLPNNQYGYSTGSSMAAPHITGAIALATANTDYNGIGIKKCILRNSKPLPQLYGKCQTNAHLDVYRFLASQLGDDQVGSQVHHEYSNLYAMTSDREGTNIWLGIQGGLVRIDPISESRDTIIHVPLSGQNLHNIAIDEDGKVWVYAETGLFNYDGINWGSIDLSNLSIERAGKLTISPAGSIWIEIGNGKLAKRTSEQWEIIQLPESESQTISIRSMKSMSGDTLYIVADYAQTSGGFPVILRRQQKRIIQYHETGYSIIDTFSHEEINTPISPSPNFPIIKSLQGNVWVGGVNKPESSNGIGYFDGNSWQSYDLAEIGLSITYPESFAIDKQGNIWIGTNNLGLIRHDCENWISYGSFDTQVLFGPPAWNKINDIVVDLNGDLWLSLAVSDANGTFYNSNVIKFSPNTTASFRTDNPTICKGEQLALTNTSLRAERYEWYIDREFVSTDTNLVYRFQQDGRYHIELKAFKDTTISTFEKYIDVLAPIKPDLGKDTTTLARAVYLNPDLPPMANYNWIRNNISVGNERNFTAYGNGTYELYVEDYCGFITSDTIEIQFEGDGNYVVPGDVNRDGKFNALDILLMATVEGTRGPARFSPHLELQPYLAQPWNGIFSDGTNHMHADANGNGVVDITKDDSLSIVYANSVHPTMHPNNLGNESHLQLEMDVLHNLQATLGEDIGIEFYLSGDSNIMNKVYGVAISVYLNQALQNGPVLSEIPNWLGVPGNNLHQNFIFDRKDQRIDFIFTRIDQRPPVASSLRSRVGGGCTITIIEDIDTTRIQASHIPLTYTLGNVLVIDKQGNFLPVDPVSSQYTYSIMLRIPPDTAMVNMTNFDISCQGDQTLISWSAWEKNIAYYELERSTDGKNFFSIFKTDGLADTLAQRRDYETLDSNADSVYYRIKIVGANDSITYSYIEQASGCMLSNRPSVLAHQSSTLKNYPNPSQGIFHTEFVLDTPLKIKGELLDMSGRRVKIIQKTLGAGNHRLNWNLFDFPKGVYVLRYSSNNQLLNQEKIILLPK